MSIHLWGSGACPVVNVSMQEAVVTWKSSCLGEGAEDSRLDQAAPEAAGASMVPSWARPSRVVGSLFHIREGPLPTCCTSVRTVFLSPGHLSTVGKHRDAEREGQMSDGTVTGCTCYSDIQISTRGMFYLWAIITNNKLWEFW